MPLELAKNIIDQMPNTVTVHPHNNGEPLLYPYLLDVISYAKKREHKVHLISNGSLFTNDMCERLINANVDQIAFSMDGYDKETFEANRIGLSWEKTLSNVKNFLKINRGRVRPVLALTIVPNIDVKKYDEFWIKQGFKFQHIDHSRQLSIMSKEQILSHPFESRFPNISCDKPFTQLAVKSNGDVVFCCRDTMACYVQGNLYRESVKQVLENRKPFLKNIEDNISIPTLCVTCGVGYSES